MTKWFKKLKKGEKAIFSLGIIAVLLLLSSVLFDFSRHRNFYQPLFYEAKEDYEKNPLDIEIIKIVQEHGITATGKMDVVKSTFYLFNFPIDVVER
ncbi:MAG: hypothetical protein IKD04_08640 [Clostridia bacterium]|nr:hypothetical protein [Clostridia bacterium]